MRRFVFAMLFTCLMGTITIGQITPSQDAYTSNLSVGTNFGSGVTLGVSNAHSSIQTTYVQFDLSEIPPGYTSASIAKATLKLYVDSLSGAGSFNVDYINGPWLESTIAYNLSPVIGGAIASGVPLTAANVNHYVNVDITPALQAWLNGSQANDGIALVANSPLSATFDSKESTTQSHPPELDVVFTGTASSITGISTASGSGLTGGGTSGMLSLSLTHACAPQQMLLWDGNAWGCAAVGAGLGTITGVVAGTDLTGGGSGGNVTLNVDITKVPQLATANTFAGNQTVNGNLSATGVVTGSSYQIGSSLFAFGSTTNYNAFLGFAGNTTMTGIANTASGDGALFRDTSGSSNSAYGEGALLNNASGYSNFAGGVSALGQNTTGMDNTAVGVQSLFLNIAGFGNTAIGYLSGGTADNSQMNSYENTFIGSESAASTGSLYDATAIGALAYVSASNSMVLGSINGVNGAQRDTNVGIGVTAPAARLHIGPTGSGQVNSLRVEGPSTAVTGGLAASFGGFGDFSIDAFGIAAGRFSVKENGDVTIGNTGPPVRIFTIQQGRGHPISDGWDSWSSRRWKTNIQPLQGALGKIEQLRGVSYDMKESGLHQIGLIAEEVGAVIPEVVTFEKNGKDAQGVDYGRLTALLIEATKAQQVLIRRQQKEIEVQRKQLEAQRKQTDNQQKQINAQRTAMQRQATKIAGLSTTMSTIETSLRNTNHQNSISSNERSQMKRVGE
jgi:hypothetical protein